MKQILLRLTLVLLVASTLLPQSATDNTPAGAIRGTVTRTRTGQPISGVTVVASSGILDIDDVRQTGSVFDSGFEVGRDVPPPLRVMLRSGAATIEGIVRDSAGKPLGGALVAIVPPQDRRQNRMRYHSVTTDENGKFSVRSVAPGAYKVFAWDSAPASAYFNPGYIARYEDRGRPISAARESTIMVDLQAISIE